MKTLLYPFLLFLSVCLPAQSSFTFDFSTDAAGWSGDFADYPVGEEAFYELDFQWTALPEPLDPSRNALKIQGNNHSDDLFMFIKRKIEGLLPNTGYQVFFQVEFASDAPTNAIGIGGAPGEAVVMKAGATRIEPMKVNDGQDFYVMNIDKANQSQPGPDMDTIGHVGVADNTTAFTLITRNNTAHPFFVTSNAEGEVWVVIGTDSGYEGLTTLYYHKIAVTFANPLATIRPISEWGGMIYPNPSSGGFTIQAPQVFQRVEVFNGVGQLMKTYRAAAMEFRTDTDLPQGTYLLRIISHQNIFQQRFIITR